MAKSKYPKKLIRLVPLMAFSKNNYASSAAA
jgi:hypothetical protein